MAKCVGLLNHSTSFFPKLTSTLSFLAVLLYVWSITERRGGPIRSCLWCFERVEVHPWNRFPGKFTLSTTPPFHFPLKLGLEDRKSLFDVVPCTGQHPRLDVFTRSHQIFIRRSSEGHRNGGLNFISIQSSIDMGLSSQYGFTLPEKWMRPTGEETGGLIDYLARFIAKQAKSA